MENLIKELNELRDTLKADGYKDWSYAQLTIDKAIKAIKNCTTPEVEKSVSNDNPYILSADELDRAEAFRKQNRF